MVLKFRRPLIALCGVGAMVIGLFAVSVSDRFPLPFNIVFIVVGMIGAVTGGLVFGVVAVAWVMKQAVQLSETSQWGRSRQR
jgi:NhaP-type Na+/H+ and K+/H+ antiporter